MRNDIQDSQLQTRNTRHATVMLLLVAAYAILASMAGADDRFASRVVSYTNLGGGVYGHPEAVLGSPTTWISEPGGPGVPAGTYACSMVYPAWNTAPDGSFLVTTIGNSTTTGQITVQFDKPIYDDPANWYGLDFIVFGNAAFIATGYITFNTDMETYRVNNSASIWQESVTVSVSPDGTNWYDYPSPVADSYWPTNAFAWNRGTHSWGDRLDPTKPVDPTLTPADFAGQYVADAIDLYKGSAGGTAYDLAESGFAWVRYIRFSSKGGEVDAVARVGRPLSIAEAKAMPDEMPVSLGINTVTAGTSDFADCFYIQSLDRSCGIKIVGGTAESGARVLLSGVMSTESGERVIRATWVGTQP
ncbi:MAG: hypothetical protein ACP5R5_00835 [Armatimonadota bacterium]